MIQDKTAKMKIKRNPAAIHAPLSTYSHQIELHAESRLLAISGQIGVDREGSMTAGFAMQLEQAWANVRENLIAANMTEDDIVKLTVYLVPDSVGTAERRKLFSELFSSIAPCMTVLYVAALGDPSMLVELDVWASAA